MTSLPPRACKTILVLLFLLPFSKVIGQSVEREELIAAYVYSFAKNIEWPENSEAFRIQLITNNKKLDEEFKRLRDSKTLKNKPIEVISSPSAIVSQQIHLVYVDNSFNSAVRSTFLQIRGYDILMVTDQFQDDRFTMINFVAAENNTLGFEVNRSNIINQGLNILPEMILLGGTDIDMARLYREALDSIQSLESKIGGLQGQYDSLYNNVKQIQDEILEQQGFIIQQSVEIEEKQRTIQSQSASLDSLSAGVYQSEQRLSALAEQTSGREEAFAKLQESIRQQEIQLEEGKLILEEQFRLIDEQDDVISDTETSLEKMVSVVSTQKKTVIMLVLFSLAAVGMLLALFRAYKVRREDARKLAEQRDELSKLLKELQNAQSQLVQSEKMASLGVLTAGIAHEINNAINFVASGIHILEAKIREITPVITKVKRLKRGDDKLQEHVDKLIEIKEKVGYEDIQKLIKEVVKNIKIGADRTAEIVKGLRTFSVSDSDILMEIDVVNEVEVALLLLNNKIKDKIDVYKQIEEVPTIDGYKGQLGQVFLNILGNAVDALNESDDPEISIGISKKGKKVSIIIEDNGEGIDEAVMDRIFDPFYTTKKIGAGTGLGLSIAYGIVERHQGTIEVVSEKNRGTRFTILLPLKIVK